MNKAAHPKIYVAGHRGMVGSALVRSLLAQGIASENLITRSRQELDLTNQLAVQEFFARERPDQVYLAAAKVGGIYANEKFKAEFCNPLFFEGYCRVLETLAYFTIDLVSRLYLYSSWRLKRNTMVSN